MLLFPFSERLAPLRRLSFIFAVVYCLVTAVAPPALANRALHAAIVQTEMARFLNHIPLIRVPITDAPGNGHQSAGATVVARLRQLGYTGEIQVVYSNEKVAMKLAYLLPPFDRNNLKAIQSFPEQKLSFIPMTLLAKQPKNRAVLAVAGADDSFLNASNLNVKFLLTLQPYTWVGSAVTSKYEDKELPDLRNLGTFIPVADPKDISDFIKQQMSHDSVLVAKMPGVQALLNNSKSFELMPIYGHKIAKSDWQLAQVLSAVETAQAKNPDAFQGGVVMPVFSDLTSLEWLLHQRSIGRKSTTIKFCQVTDRDFSANLEGLKKGEVLVVRVGSLPKSIFEYIYSRATLPPMVEGMNSINFMRLLGRPYFTSVDHESVHFLGISTRAHFELPPDAKAAFDLTWAATTQLETQNFTQASAAEFIIQSKVNGSAVQQLFESYSLDPAKNLMQDKLFRGLQAVRRQFSKWEGKIGAQSIPRPSEECERVLTEETYSL